MEKDKIIKSIKNDTILAYIDGIVTLVFFVSTMLFAAYGFAWSAAVVGICTGLMATVEFLNIATILKNKEELNKIENKNEFNEIQQYYDKLKEKIMVETNTKEVYKNLSKREKVLKNKYGNIKNKKMKEDFLNEFVCIATFPASNGMGLESKRVLIKNVIEQIENYDFSLISNYEQILAHYEEMQKVLDKYSTQTKKQNG